MKLELNKEQLMELIKSKKLERAFAALQNTIITVAETPTTKWKARAGFDKECYLARQQCCKNF
jgi:hypothetical protein